MVISEKNHPILDLQEARKSDESSKLGGWFFETLDVSTRIFPAAVTRHDLYQTKKSTSTFSNQKALPSRHFWQTKPGNHTHAPAVAEAFLAERTSELINKSSMVQDRWEYTWSNQGILAGNVSGWFSSQPAVHVVSLSGKISFFGLLSSLTNVAFTYIAIAACFSFYACRSVLKWSPPFCCVSENCQPTWNHPTTKHRLIVVGITEITQLARNTFIPH